MFSRHQEELKRRAEVEKLARERAKVKAQREEQERTSRAVAGVNHLEIPAELAFIFSKLDGMCCHGQIVINIFMNNYNMRMGQIELLFTMNTSMLVWKDNWFNLGLKVIADKICLPKNIYLL
jgi:hypothetical protein